MNNIKQTIFKDTNNLYKLIKSDDNISYLAKKQLTKHLTDLIDDLRELKKCSNCNKLSLEDELEPLFNSDNLVCNSCYDENRNQVKSYHSTENKFLRDVTDLNNQFLIGFELELELKQNYDTSDYDLNSILYDYKDFFRFEHDGSLDTGFETISNTFTYNYLQNIGFKKLENYLKDYVYTNKNTGLHIHINRALFDEADIKKIYDYFDINIQQFKKLSNRTKFNYCKPYSNLSNLEYDYNGLLVSDERYIFVNVCPKTIEFRFFASSKQYQIVYRQIQTLLLFISYYLETQLNDTFSYEFEHFLKYVKQRNETIYNFIIDRIN